MKRLKLILALTGLLVSSAAFSNAPDSAKQTTDLTIVLTQAGSQEHRAPLSYEIEVTFLSSTRLLEVFADSSWEGEVRIRLNGMDLFYSPTIVCSFCLPVSEGVYTIEISGACWIATGTIAM